MPAITDAEYYLPQVFALSYHYTFQSGANAPILVRGIERSTNQKGDFVVKLTASERMKEPAGNMRELIAAWMVMEMNIPAARPVVVEIIPELAQTVEDLSLKRRLQQSIGNNFGTRYQPDCPTFIPNSLSEKLLPFAQNLFAFDLLIQNADRNPAKPNMLVNGEEIIAIDHELAFSFVYALFAPAYVWEMQEQHISWVRKHVLYPFIKGKNFDFERFEEKFLKLNVSFWDKCWQLLPEQWRVQQFDTIRNHFLALLEKKDLFMQTLKVMMS